MLASSRLKPVLRKHRAHSVSSSLVHLSVLRHGEAASAVIDSVDDAIGTSDWTLKTLIGSLLIN